MFTASMPRTLVCFTVIGAFIFWPLAILMKNPGATESLDVILVVSVGAYIGLCAGMLVWFKSSTLTIIYKGPVKISFQDPKVSVEVPNRGQFLIPLHATVIRGARDWLATDRGENNGAEAILVRRSSDQLMELHSLRLPGYGTMHRDNDWTWASDCALDCECGGDTYISHVESVRKCDGRDEFECTMLWCCCRCNAKTSHRHFRQQLDSFFSFYNHFTN